METPFEDLIAQRFPAFTKETVKELVKWVKNYFQNEIVQKGKVLHPVHHSDKLTNFTKFADFIHKADAQTTKKDIIQYVNDYWDPYYGMDHHCMDSVNPLDTIGGYTKKQMLKEAEEAIAKESKRMFLENFKTQGAVIIVQYVLLWYLWQQSKRANKVIQSSIIKLEQIKEECIMPALNIMYVVDTSTSRADTADSKEETKSDDYMHCFKKYKTFNENLNAYQHKLAQVYLTSATRRLEDNMDLLEDKKQASMINGVIGCVATLASTYFTAGLGSGFASLLGSAATRGSALCIQQGVFTVASGTATAGFVGITVKHRWNYQKCQELLDQMNQLKKELNREQEVLENMKIVIKIARDK